MAQQIKQANIFGRLGSGVGKGLAEQVPKEIENYRLRSGLQNLADLSDQGGLSQAQFLAKAAGTYGATPQHIQSFGQLAQQQARGQALVEAEGLKQRQERQNASNVFSNQPASPTQKRQGEEAPSITQRKPLEEIQRGYIPPTLPERRQDAGERYNANPARYNNNPQMALDEVDKEVAINQERNTAYEQQHQRLTTAQDNAVNRLKGHSDKLGLKNVPANVYSDIEDSFIQDILPKSEGGRGLTEQEAIKKRGKELEDIDRDYTEVASIGDWGVQGRKSSDTMRSIRAIQKSFKKRGDTENLADTLISKDNFSPSKAYAMAQPVHDSPELNDILKEIPKADSAEYLRRIEREYNPQDIDEVSNYKRGNELKVVKKLASALGSEGSPLAVGYELKKLGYDPDVWTDYLIKNSDKLNLTVKQLRQLKKSNSYLGTKNDWWLDAFSGIDR